MFDQTTSNGVSRAVMSVGGTLATSGNGEGLLRLWDVTIGEERLAFRTDRIDGFAPGSSGWMKFTPDGNTLLYMDANRNAAPVLHGHRPVGGARRAATDPRPHG